MEQHRSLIAQRILNLKNKLISRTFYLTRRLKSLILIPNEFNIGDGMKKRKSRSTPPPRFNIETAEYFVKKIAEDHGDGTFARELLPPLLKTDNENSGAFLLNLAALRKYGLLDDVRNGETHRLSQLALQMLKTNEPNKRETAIQQAISNVDLIEKLTREYGLKLPEEKDLERALILKFDVKNPHIQKWLTFINIAFTRLRELEYKTPAIGDKGDVQSGREQDDVIVEGPQPNSSRFEIILESGEKTVMFLPPKATKKDLEKMILLLRAQYFEAGDNMTEQ